MAGAIYSKAQKSIALAFTKARKKAGFKQADLATAIKKHQSFISDIERGQRRIDVLEAFVVARAMGYDPVEFYASLIDEVATDTEL
jgi:transcriptional regulator with XRE-family HTH domain